MPVNQADGLGLELQGCVRAAAALHSSDLVEASSSELQDCIKQNAGLTQARL